MTPYLLSEAEHATSRSRGLPQYLLQYFMYLRFRCLAATGKVLLLFDFATKAVLPIV